MKCARTVVPCREEAVTAVRAFLQRIHSNATEATTNTRAGGRENSAGAGIASAFRHGVQPGQRDLGNTRNGAAAAEVELHRNHRQFRAAGFFGVLCKKVLRRPEQWPLDRFSVINAAAWAGETVCIIAGGPSVTRDRVAVITAAHAAGACRVVVVNDAYSLAPDADLLYFADARWWEWHREREGFKAFKGEKCTIENTGSQVTDDTIHMVRNAARVAHGKHNLGDDVQGGLSPWPNALRTGQTGGYQALGLAIAAGAARVVLLGIDMRFINGRSHWHKGHPGFEHLVSDADYNQVFRMFFEEMKIPEGVEVLNASPESAVRKFRKVEIAEVFA